MTNFFFERYRPEICRGLHKWCSERILRRFRSFRARKNFSKVASFLTFFAYPGSQISWKMTNFFFERYRPEICCGLHKWCCEGILRCFRSFRAKKNFPRLPIFWLFLHIRGHRFLEKWLTTFLRNTGLKFVVDCTIVLRTNFKAFKVVSSEKKIFQKLEIFLLFCISGVTDFLKNDQLLFWEIPAWNFLWTTEMVLRTNYKAFWVVSSQKNFFQKFEIFWLFLHIRGHRFLEKWPTSFLRDTGLKFFRGLHKWCCERILRCFRSFRAKKNFPRLPIFWLFLHIRGHRFLEKWLTTFLRETGLKFVVDCTNGVANEF